MWPFDVLERIFDNSFNFREIKLFEAQGELGGGSLILAYASTLPMDTLPLLELHRRTFSQRRHHWRSRKAESWLKIYPLESGRIDRKYTQSWFKLSSTLYAAGRNDRFINKRFSELGTERCEKVLEESCGLRVVWELEELKYKLTNIGKKEIVSIRRRAGQVVERKQTADRNLRGAEHYELILRKVES